jgi:RimJ/RimL family protein N-acetyltransferase
MKRNQKLRLKAIADEDNPVNQRVLDKAGFKREGGFEQRHGHV